MTISLQQAADRAGVHYQTAYRWVREGKLAAAKIGGSYVVSTADVDALTGSRRTPQPVPAVISVRDWSQQASRFYDALVAGDERAAGHIVSRLHTGGIDVIDLLDGVVVPALKRIGDGWHAGLVSIAAEHRATAICERLLADISRESAGRPRGTVVVTTPPGDRHAVPALMAAAVLRERHWRVHHLGADMPAWDLADFAHDLDADLVVLSVTSTALADAARDTAEVLTARGLRVLLGRPGATLRQLLEAAGRGYLRRGPRGHDGPTSRLT